MRRLRKFAALFVFLISVGPLWLVDPAVAEPTTGLTVEVYTYSPQSTPERQAYELCATGETTMSQIAHDWSGGVVAGCQSDFVLIHYSGYITMPVDGPVTFHSTADDGFYLEIGGSIVINDWFLKGCWGTSGTHDFQAGVSQKIDVWYYEYGGGACSYLYYEDPINGIVVVPAEAFTTEPVVPVIPPSLNSPTNIQAVAQGTDVLVTWDTPVDTGTVIEHYAITWNYGEGNPGWGISAFGNSALIPGLPLDTDISISVRTDNDTVPVYSSYSEPIIINIPKPVEPPVEPPVDPEEPVDPVDPVDPPTEPVDPPVEPVTPPVEPIDPPVEVIEPPIVIEPPVEPEVEPETPSVTEVDSSTIDPTTLTEEQVNELQTVAYATLATSEPGSEEYEEALDQLFVAAQADDIEVDPSLAAIPLLGNVAVGLTDAVNFIGNVGSDMSPKVRELAEKQVLVSVVAVGAAVQAAAGAATAAAAASSSPSSRRI